MSVATEVVGFLASLIAFALFLPQARRTWQVRDDPHALAGISTGTQWLLLTNAALWGVYAVLTEAFWVGAPGLVNGPLAIATLALIARAKHRTRVRRAHAGQDLCDLCEEGIEHRVFITAPPGWGSVMPCSPFGRRNGVIVQTDEDIIRIRATRAPRPRAAGTVEEGATE